MRLLIFEQSRFGSCRSVKAIAGNLRQNLFAKLPKVAQELGLGSTRPVGSGRALRNALSS